MASGLTLPRLRFVDVAGDVLFPEKTNKQTNKNKKQNKRLNWLIQNRLDDNYCMFSGKRLVINYS